MFRVRRQARRRGLTLIEVMVALGVLVILVGGIFMVVKASLQTVLMIDNSASRQDELTNLVDVLRSSFRNLPPRARLVAQPVKSDGAEEYLFIVRNAPGFLSWLAEPEAEDTIVLLSLRHDDENDGWRVCMKRFAPPGHFPEKNFDAKTILHLGEKIPWLELVGDFRSIVPRFYDSKNRIWKDKWNEPETRPGLIELSMQTEQVRDQRSQTTVLWIPPVKEDKPS